MCISAFCKKKNATFATSKREPYYYPQTKKVKYLFGTIKILKNKTLSK